MSRKQPNLRELLATALLQLFPYAITFEEAKAMTADEIIAKVRKTHDVHHWTYVAVLGGSNHPTNMSWMAAVDHDKRTHKTDVPTIAKIKRAMKKVDDLRATFDLQTLVEARAICELSGPPVHISKAARTKIHRVAKKYKWPSRPMGSKTHRRKMDGSTVRKK